MNDCATRLALAVDTQAGAGGAAVAAYVDSEPVADLWAGTFAEDTLVHTWSAVKPVAGTCLLTVCERSGTPLSTPVREVWPELSGAADGRMRIVHVLGHAAGLASVPPPATAASLIDWDRAVRALEEAELDWPPGEHVGEHTLTFGHLVGTLVRRLDGRTLGRFLEEELSQPLGLDVHIGLDADELERTADTVGLTDEWWDAARGPRGSLRYRALGGGMSGALVNGREWRCAEIPAVNGHATARGLARFYDAMRRGQLPAACRSVAAEGNDLVLGERVTWTRAGGRVDGLDVGMGGLGGQWAAERPTAGLAWAFLTNVMGSSDRAQLVEDVLVQCVAHERR